MQGQTVTPAMKSLPPPEPTATGIVQSTMVFALTQRTTNKRKILPSLAKDRKRHYIGSG
jgi:hypothetical protein